MCVEGGESSERFKTRLDPSLLIWPHVFGPFLAGNMCSAAKSHMALARRSRGHSQVVAAQFNFLRPAAVGEAIINVKPIETSG